MWSKASKTFSHEGANLGLDTLANGKPVKKILDEKEIQYRELLDE